MSFSWILTLIALVLSNSLSGTRAYAHGDPSTGYKQCHLLCSNEMGRSELRLIPGDELEKEASFGYRIETLYIQPYGHYETEFYERISPRAKSLIVEVLPSVWYRPFSNLQINLSVPLEWNRTENIVLPTLHEVDGTHTEINPGGIFISAYFRLDKLSRERSQTWAGLGYKMSKEEGTEDVGPDLAHFPDKAIEALGVGSDDIYLILRQQYFPEGVWSFGAGVEYRLGMLPRFERLFATTWNYQLWAQRPFDEKWFSTLRLSGFYTEVRTVDVIQKSFAILNPMIGYNLSTNTALTLGVAGEIPVKTLHENVIQTLSGNITLVYRQ